MWSNQPTREQPESHDRKTDQPPKQTKRSPTTVLVEVAASFAAAYGASESGSCSQCRGYRDPRISTAQHPQVFCSQQCEREFVLTALKGLTLEDCIRLQERLELLLRGAQRDRTRC
jgi:hypothetical protein